jgi:predicted RND superfamily exporter protein
MQESSTDLIKEKRVKLAHKVLDLSTKHYNKVIFAWVGLAILLVLLSFLPSVYPRLFGFLNPVQVDADPQNMLNYDEPVRVTDREMKKKFNLYDIMAVGVVNEKHPDGVFNPETLGKIYQLTEYARTLHWEEGGKRVGVVEVDMISPSTVDSIEPGEGVIRFEWLMNKPPETREEALEIRRKALRIPFLKDTLISTKGDIPGRALAIYLPLTDKKLSYGIYQKLVRKIEELPRGDDVFHVYITGLPVAENTFVVEMFLQMAISGPTAMLIIFILLYFFFRKLVLIVSPMIVAFLSVIFTMCSFIVCGFPIHVLSSMIPIFIMPVAVLDSIHVLSEFFDRYQETRDRKKTIIAVIKNLSMPMLYTSLTSAAGFGSLVFAPIPPVQLSVFLWLSV